MLVFSDDEDAASHLVKEGAVAASTFRPADLASVFERDIFEFAMLAGCQRVYGSNSKFVALARAVFGIDVIELRKVIAADMGKGLILDDLRDFPEQHPPIDRAKELAWLATELRDSLTLDERVTYWREATSLDPSNTTYRLVLAAELARLDRGEEADATWLEVAESDFRDRGGLTAELTTINPKIIDSAVGRIPKPPSPERFPYWWAFYGAQRGRKSETRKGRQFAKLAHVLAPPSELLLARYVDELLAAERARLARRLLKQSIRPNGSAPVLLNQITRANQLLSEDERPATSTPEPIPSSPPNFVLRLRRALRGIMIPKS